MVYGIDIHLICGKTGRSATFSTLVRVACSFFSDFAVPDTTRALGWGPERLDRDECLG